jgi:hypothetical protein
MYMKDMKQVDPVKGIWALEMRGDDGYSIYALNVLK